VGYRYGEGIALVNLGDALLDLDRAEEAIDYLQQAQRTFAEIETRWTATRLRPALLGRCYSVAGTRRGRPGLHLRQALTSHQDAGNRQRQAAR
jgi:tetratricopeptide (TPR) repeat protein